MFILAALAIMPVICIAQIVPTSPGPGQTFTAGSQCSMDWQPDATGTWGSITIDLMTGSNNNMSLVTNVVSGLDGASSSSYTWTCPEVNPYSAIYFYQFSQKDASTNTSPAWTTRFTIASSDGTTTPPEHSSQPNGDSIPWGVGQLVSAETEETTSLSSATDVPTAMTSVVNMAHPTAPPVETSASASAAPPEVTLNVPVPKSNKNSRRQGFSTVYARASGLPRRGTNSLPACKGRRKTHRRRLSELHI